MIVPILPKDKKAVAAADGESEAQAVPVDDKSPTAPSENIKIVFASIFISQVAEIID